MDFYGKIAEEIGLPFYPKNRFIKFMRKRFERLVAPGYAKEWAMRFRNSNEYAYADSKSKEILTEIDRG